MNMKRVLNLAFLVMAAALLVLPTSGAFAVTNITPDHGINTGTVFVTDLEGTDLPPDASVNLMLAGQTNITGQFITWVDPTRITCVLDLGGKVAGGWDVVVVNNTDGSEALLTSGFTVRNPAPSLASVTPGEGVNTGVIQITDLSGSGFLPGASVNLTNGAVNLTGTDVSVPTGSRIECRFDLNGASPGLWDIVVTNTDSQSAILNDAFTIRSPAPVISSITPASGRNNEVIGITNLAGASFMSGASVHLAKANETNISTIDGPIVQPGMILCFLDLNGKSVGAWDVVVTNPDGQSAVLPGAFSISYPQAPTVTGITPSSGENDAPVSIAGIAGTGFQPGAAVLLMKEGQPQIPGTEVVVANSTSIGCSFNITGAATGDWDLKVSNNDGQYSVLPGGFTVRNPAPSITGIVPQAGLNSGVVSITNLTGTGFLPGASVTLKKAGEGDIAGTMVNVVDSGLITCTLDLTGAEPGLWNVQVQNTDTQSALLPDAFTIAYPAPEVATIDPASAITGQTVIARINGSNFLDGADVLLMKSGEPNLSVVVDEVTGPSISCSIDLSGAVAGAWSVMVTNPDGQASTLTDGFTVLNPAPTVTGANPSAGTNGGVSGLIELAGTGFLDEASVSLRKAGQPDIPAMGSPVVVDGGKILCFFDLEGADVGAWDVVVTNTDAQTGTLLAGFFIRYPSAPAVLNVTPDSGVNNGALAISSLSGTGFQPGASVVLVREGSANLTASSVTVNGPTEITCVVDLDNAAEGLWDLVVTNDDGQHGILAGGFRVVFPAPAVSGIVPSVGINNAPVSITNLSGSDFRAPATIKLTRMGEPDIPGSGVIVESSQKITCVFPLTGAKAGQWNLVVTNPDGQYAIAANAFSVENPAPALSSITPARGPNDRAVFISALNGTGFLDGATVQLTRNGQAPINATGVSVESSSRINCTLNLTGGATGKWNVVVRNTDGKIGTLTNGFQITPPPPVPNFTADTVYGTAPLTVHFSDLSTNSPFIWSWNFGDGSSVVGLDQADPVHTYNNPGVYNVTLLVRNDGGETQVTKNGYITAVVIPVAGFTAEPVSGTAPLLVKFADTSDGDPTKWLWKFGDGGYSTEQNPYHLYRNPGLYTVVLTVYNGAGSDTETIQNLIRVTSLPVAGFSANRTAGPAPLAVQFKDVSTGSPTAWLWTFGDGGTSAEQNPVHVFGEPGTYSVQLNVSNEAGNSTETREAFITVGQGLQADFEYATSNPEQTAPLSVAFTDRSIGKVLKWTWRFGDGYVSTDRNPIHNYPLPGTYEVTLTVTGLSGSDTMTKTITVKSPLKADFVAEPTTGSAPLTVVLSDISIGVPTDRTWIISKDAGNIVVIHPAERNQVYTINEPGLYSVTMNVVDGFGESDSKTRTKYINVLPFPP